MCEVMNTRKWLTRTVAVVGTVLVWLPLVATLLLSLIGTIVDRTLRFDFLMPAELFPLVLVGGALLVGAALLARSRTKLIGGSLGMALVTLLGSQGVAILSGLAHGETGTDSVWFFIVIGLLGAYWVALIVLDVAGLLLLRDLFGPLRTPAFR